MSNLAFDTHKFVKNLTKTGMKADQAEVLAETYADLLNDRLATKDDIALLKKDIDTVRAEITVVRKDMDSLEERLTGKMEAQEERLTNLIERTQTRTILTVTGLLGFLILILEFYG